ncbi:hypothetical protein RHMOL_RhmolUnG0003000 [Rhododendron molle]|nr:hypothetical protein RHMOL_RhmolUnG0003000 [Rhododendron molle]
MFHLHPDPHPPPPLRPHLHTLPPPYLSPPPPRVVATTVSYMRRVYIKYAVLRPGSGCSRMPARMMQLRYVGKTSMIPFFCVIPWPQVFQKRDMDSAAATTCMLLHFLLWQPADQQWFCCSAFLVMAAATVPCPCLLSDLVPNGTR